MSDDIQSKFFSFVLSTEMHKEMRQRSFDTNTTMACICRRALREYLRKGKDTAKTAGA